MKEKVIIQLIDVFKKIRRTKEMNDTNLVINTHNFEEAKKGLKEFAEKTPKNMRLEKVDTDKGVGKWLLSGLTGQGWGKAHNVTGAELNSLTSQIQKHLIEINNINLKFINEIGRVYVALEALDNDYIKAIIISIKATEETSNGLKIAQDRIDEIVKNQSLTLEVLKKHKQKLDEFSHLEDIDELWNQCQAFHNNISELADVVSHITNAVNEHNTEIESLTKNIQEISEESSTLKQSIETISNELQTLNDYVNELNKYDHLKDIDTIWEETERQKRQLDSLGKKANDIQELTITATKANDEKIFNLESKQTAEMQQISKKFLTLYMVAGGALGMAIIELLLILFK